MNKPLPTVMQIIPSLFSGGAERGCVDVALALAQAGGKAIVASSGGGKWIKELEDGGVTFIPLPVKSKNPLNIIMNIWRIAALIQKHNVDIVHVRSRAPAWSAYFAAKKTGVKFMTTFHSTYNFKSGLKRFYNSIMTRGVVVIAISDFIRNHILENYDVSPDKIRLIHRWVDLEKFAEGTVTPERKAKLAADWELPAGKKVILLPTRVARWKGHDTVVEAMHLLARNDVICVILDANLGRKGFVDELLGKIKSYSLEKAVKFVKHCDDMPAAYSLVDVVISASKEPEAFGRVIVEAQIMGRPLVVTDIGAVKETVVAGKTAFVVPPGDAKAMADAIQRALSLSEKERLEMAKAAKEHVKANFDKKRMCEKTLQVYQEIAGKIS